jgi:hypothetical protein
VEQVHMAGELEFLKKTSCELFELYTSDDRKSKKWMKLANPLFLQKQPLHTGQRVKLV